MKDEGFHGLRKFQKRNYWFDEVHKIEDIEGCYCIAVEVPGVNHDPQIFTVSIRGYDNECNNDDKNIKRPAIFGSERDCTIFMNEMRFLHKTLRIIQIDRGVASHKLFQEVGAYKIHKPLIQTEI